MPACATQEAVGESVCGGNLILPVPDTDFRDFLDEVEELSRFAPEIVAAIEAECSGRGIESGGWSATDDRPGRLGQRRRGPVHDAGPEP